jgi:hypothetical protein
MAVILFVVLKYLVNKDDNNNVVSMMKIFITTIHPPEKFLLPPMLPIHSWLQ